MSEGNQTTSPKAIESLRYILEQQLACSVAYEVAAEIGESLIDFYELLATKEGIDE